MMGLVWAASIEHCKRLREACPQAHGGGICHGRRDGEGASLLLGTPIHQVGYRHGQ